MSSSVLTHSMDPISGLVGLEAGDESWVSVDRQRNIEAPGNKEVGCQVIRKEIIDKDQRLSTSRRIEGTERDNELVENQKESLEILKQKRSLQRTWSHEKRLQETQADNLL